MFNRKRESNRVERKEIQLSLNEFIQLGDSESPPTKLPPPVNYLPEFRFSKCDFSQETAWGFNTTPISREKPLPTLVHSLGHSIKRPPPPKLIFPSHKSFKKLNLVINEEQEREDDRLYSLIEQTQQTYTFLPPLQRSLPLEVELELQTEPETSFDSRKPPPPPL